MPIIHEDKDDDYQSTCKDYICKDGSPVKKGTSKWSKIDGILIGRFQDGGMNEH